MSNLYHVDCYQSNGKNPFGHFKVPNSDQKTAKLKKNYMSFKWLLRVLILAMTVYFPMTLALHKSQVHCVGNTQLWACSLLNPLLCLQRQVAKLASELFFHWPLLRTITWWQICEDALQATVVCVLPRVTIERRYLGRWCSKTVTADSGKPLR